STTHIYTLSLHDALPIYYSKTLMFYFNLYKDGENVKQALQGKADRVVLNFIKKFQFPNPRTRRSFNESVEDEIRLKPYQEILRRSEEHTSELQSRFDLVC